MSAQPEPLFDPRKTEPIRVERHYHPDGVYVAVCTACGTRLRYRELREEARLAGLAALADHVCVGPGDLDSAAERLARFRGRK